MTPFKALYGKEVTAIHDYKPGSNDIASIDSSLVEHQRLIDLLRQALTKARDRMVKQVNKNEWTKNLWSAIMSS